MVRLGATPWMGPVTHLTAPASGSVMVMLIRFRRRIAGRLHCGRRPPAGQVRWLDAREHAGENVGDTGTHTINVELKDGGAASPGGRLGPVPS